jgi:5-carboxymethyl-2-hydroxymuconate isomerase
MSIVPQNQHDEELFNTISWFFKSFKIGDLLRKCGACKQKGVPVMDIFKYKLCNVFSDRSMYMQLRTKSFSENFSKNTYYRFLNSVKTNWFRFMTLLAKRVIDSIEPLTGDDRVNAFVVDDSLFERSSCKKTQLGAKVFDHCDMRYKKGFRLMTLSWTDGNTLIPVNSCLLSSQNENNILGTDEHYDGRSLAGQRRKLAKMKGTKVMIELIKRALSAGLTAEYVLFDTWFSAPAQLIDIKRLGLDSIAMIRKSSKVRYIYEGERLSINKIFGICKKRRGKSKYLLSVNVFIEKDGVRIPAKIVCARNKKKKKDWVALISTNTEISEDEIIRIYGKRWQIEVFFKTCKSMLNLVGECHSLSYDALTAHVAIVFARYTLLALTGRRNEDMRTLGELFFYLADEMADITFARAFDIILKAVFGLRLYNGVN